MTNRDGIQEEIHFAYRVLQFTQRHIREADDARVIKKWKGYERQIKKQIAAHQASLNSRFPAQRNGPAAAGAASGRG